jgi:hypothetical protein
MQKYVSTGTDRNSLDLRNIHQDEPLRPPAPLSAAPDVRVLHIAEALQVSGGPEVGNEPPLNPR